MSENDGKSATDGKDTETVESLKAKLAEAEESEAKWKEMSRKNEDGKKANKDAASERDDLKAKLEALETAKLSDAEKADKRIRDLEEAVKAEQEARKSSDLGALRARIGAEKGLPPAFIARLQGEDEDTIASDADELLKAIPEEAKSQWPDLGQGQRGESGATDDPLLASVKAKVGIQ